MALHKNCNGMTRRDCLKLGLGAVLGGGLAHALRLRAASPSSGPAPRARGCILIWMDGGPSSLGARYAPFVVADNPNAPGFRVRDVALPRGLSGERFGSRGEARVQLDRLQRIADRAAGDPANALDEHYQQAYSLVTSPQ